MNWIKLPSMKKVSSYHAASISKQKLYIVGGEHGTNVWLDSSDVLDVVKRTWSEGPNLPFALSVPVVVTNQSHSFSVVIGSKPEEVEIITILTKCMRIEKLYDACWRRRSELNQS